jgi:[NiFe] hydrogenase diaphorase moiety large subunit
MESYLPRKEKDLVSNPVSVKMDTRISAEEVRGRHPRGLGKTMAKSIKEICKCFNYDRTRLVDVVLAAQKEFGGVSGEAMETIAKQLDTHRVEVESVVSFYAFLSEKPNGKVMIRLCNDVIDRLQGADQVAAAFEEELGIRMGETSEDGITLTQTACIGMSDQAPAALINDVVVTRLSTDKARDIVANLRCSPDPQDLVRVLGDGNNAHDLVRAMVRNNVRLSGPVVLTAMEPGAALGSALSMSPAEVIRNVKTSRLRGRGGAGFPTGMKWEYTRNADAEKRYIICNADEGEPGTFKDRVILTEYPDVMFEGMTIGGYAIGATEGILYLRAEYAYLHDFLESVLVSRREQGLLGQSICGKEGFDFDIRIQMGAGAYICGEETALISSCEGTRGDPKNRPPFPAQHGYLGYPTSVNNVETFCCVARILEHGPGWFSQHGSPGSSGTKLLSVSGDCLRPGVYEIPFGTPLEEVLKLVGGEGAQGVQVGGPSGQMIGPADYGRTICYEDLVTGGSVMVFGRHRDLLEITHSFMEFFVEESCGYCTPCRVGNVLLIQKLENILRGNGKPEDLAYLRELGETVKATSRCGLGQTSPNPVLTTLENFFDLYESRVQETEEGQDPGFDLSEAVAEATQITGRDS